MYIKLLLLLPLLIGTTSFAEDYTIIKVYDSGKIEEFSSATHSIVEETGDRCVKKVIRIINKNHYIRRPNPLNTIMGHLGYSGTVYSGLSYQRSINTEYRLQLMYLFNESAAVGIGVDF